jgi:hypothetical protein
MDLFAPGTKHNPNEKARKEQADFQAWQQAENERLQAEQAAVLKERLALMATMTSEEWEEFLQLEAIENAKRRAPNTRQYELR